MSSAASHIAPSSKASSASRRRALAALLAGCGCWLLKPFAAFAEQWNQPAFDARNLEEALRAAGAAQATASADIVIKAPEIAENGAQVPIEITSSIPGTQTLHIFVDKNPQPLAGSFVFLASVEPYISTRIKMSESSIVRVVVQAGEKSFVATRDVKVTIGGCGV